MDYSFYAKLAVLLNNPELPSYIQNLLIILVAILIPVAIFIFSLEKDNFLERDKVVILDRVIQAKRILFSIFLTFISLFFWEFSDTKIKIIFFAISIASIYILTESLTKSYLWIRASEDRDIYNPKNTKNKIIDKYLDEIENLSEKERFWILTWENEILDTTAEVNFLKKFIKHIDNLFKKKNFNLLIAYLKNFEKSIKKRNLSDWRIFDDLFVNLLKWHHNLYKEEIAVEEKIEIYQARSIITSLIEKNVIAALENSTSYLFFKKLEKHLSEKSEDYAKKLICLIAPVIFENINKSSDENDIWNIYFNKNWKITLDNIEKENNFIPQIFLGSFLRWSEPRIRFPISDFDENLSEVVENLFPAIDPVLWSKILTLAMRSYYNGARMKSLIEGKKRNFGIISRMFSGDFTSIEESSRELTKRINNEEDNAINLAIALFHYEFSGKKLEVLQSELRELQYKENSDEEINRKDWLDIFSKFNQKLIKS